MNPSRPFICYATLHDADSTAFVPIKSMTTMLMACATCTDTLRPKPSEPSIGPQCQGHERPRQTHFRGQGGRGLSVCARPWRGPTLHVLRQDFKQKGEK